MNDLDIDLRSLSEMQTAALKLKNPRLYEYLLEKQNMEQPQNALMPTMPSNQAFFNGQGMRNQNLDQRNALLAKRGYAQ